MEDTSGFYKLDGDLLYGPNFVLNANYELERLTHDQYEYPIDGWYWFDSEEEARVFFGLPEITKPTDQFDIAWQEAPA
jgi:hypothetical protein